jgi:acetate CoA/acetoacetate CoA-transferase alpha subunit
VNKIINLQEAAAMIRDGDTVMAGGFYGAGTSHKIIEEIIRQGKKDLTLITCEGGGSDQSVGKLLAAGCVKRLVVSWVGHLTNITELVNMGMVALELNPQETLIERIRTGGCGLGGVLTQVGLGTDIETSGTGRKLKLNGEEWIYHTPLRANVGIVAALNADTFGNLSFHSAENNYNKFICMAADTVIAEIGRQFLKVGSLQARQIDVSGIFVDYLIEGWT